MQMATIILSFSVSFSGLRLLHHLPFIIHPVQTVSGQHHQMLVSSRSTAVTETTKLWRREVASIWMYIFIFTSMNLSVHICCTASLWNISHCLYLSLSTYVFTFCAISIFMLSFSLLLLLPLFLSLTIAYEVSLQNTNVLQSPWKQWELRGRQGTVREFIWCWHCYQIRSSLVCVCVCMCVHMHGTHSKVCFCSLLFMRVRWDLFNDRVFPVHMAARLCRVDASGSSSSLPNSPLLFLALLTGSVSSITAREC